MRVAVGGRIKIKSASPDARASQCIGPGWLDAQKGRRRILCPDGDGNKGRKIRHSSLVAKNRMRKLNPKYAFQTREQALRSMMQESFSRNLIAGARSFFPTPSAREGIG
jgi:hypothetical protein